MKKRLNKILAMFLAGTLCVSFVPLTAIATDGDGEYSTDAAIVEVDDGEAPAASDLGETPEVPEIVEPAELIDEPSAEEAVEAPAAEAVTVDEAADVEETGTVVATVGDMEFTDLQDAVNYVARSRALNLGEINLKADQVKSLTVPMTMTFNLNGFTWIGEDRSTLTCTASNVDIAVNGPGTMQAAEGYRVLSVTGSSDKVILNEATLIGGGSILSYEATAKSQGGILYAVNSSVEANGCTFKNGITNTSDFGAGGGAISTSNSNLELSNCTFEKNTSYNGGAIAVSSGSCSINDCTFKENAATKGIGGAIKIYNLKTDVTIKGSTFEDNIAGKESSSSAIGGAIGISSCSSVVFTIDECEFTGNSAPYSYGGAIGAYDSSNSANKLKELNIVNSTFKNNSALRGGAVCVIGDKLVIDSTTITNNSATYDSTTAKNKGVAYPASSTSGGVHFFPGVNGSSFIVQGDSHIYGNKVEKEVTALMLNGLGVASEVYIQDNSSKSTTVSGLENLESIDADGSSYVITKYQYASNVSNSYKYAQRYYSVKAEPVRIYLCPAASSCNHTASDHTYKCEAIDEAYKLAVEKEIAQIFVCGQVEITNSNKKYLDLSDSAPITYSRCLSNSKGSMFKIVANDVTFKNVVIDGANVDSGSSPMIYAPCGTNLEFGQNAVIKNAKRTACTGSFSGGAALEIARGNSSSKLVIDGAEFSGNIFSAGNKANGGAIYAWHTKIEISGGTFDRNTSSCNAGFMYTIYDSELDITGGTFSNNGCSNEGGALALYGIATDGVWHGTTTEITGGRFEGNYSTKNGPGNYFAGGAIYNGTGSHLTIKNALIANNYQDDADKGYQCEAAVANCQMSDMAIYEEDGAAIFDNGSNHADVAWWHISQSGDMSRATVSTVAMGGGYNNWVALDTFSANPREVDPSYYQGAAHSFQLRSNLDDDAKAWARNDAKVFFEGNHTYVQGAAIMNNGYMTLGTEMKSLRVTKDWVDENGEVISKDDEGKLPDEIRVTLAYVNEEGKAVAASEQARPDRTRVLTASNNWTAFWSDLGMETQWTVIEEPVPGYEVQIEDKGDSRERIFYVKNVQLTNKWKNELTNISAEKWWEDQDNLYNIRPETIELTLKTDNGASDTNGNDTIDESEYIAVGNPVTVKPNDVGSWHYDFTDLAKYTTKGEEIKYMIVETPVDGYVSTTKPIVASKKPVLNENGEEDTDEEGNVKTEDVLTWIVGEGDDAKEWSGYNITNSLEFANLEFTKSYEGQVYQDADGNGNSTAVFSIIGKFNGTEFYNNVLSANFTGEATETITVKNLLVGATYTVEELEVTNSGYVAKSDTRVDFLMTKEGPVKVDDNESAGVITISFTNAGDNTEKPNQGIINRYKFSVDDGNSVNGEAFNHDQYDQAA